jgi:hypothetical protein
MPDTNNSNARNFFLDQLSVNVTYSTTTYHAAPRPIARGMATTARSREPQPRRDGLGAGGSTLVE